jgi:hypothetical protein
MEHPLRSFFVGIKELQQQCKNTAGLRPAVFFMTFLFISYSYQLPQRHIYTVVRQ